MGDQTYTRWFTDYPPTHVNAGMSVEVMPASFTDSDVERVAEALYDFLYRLRPEGAPPGPNQAAHDMARAALSAFLEKP